MAARAPELMELVKAIVSGDDETAFRKIDSAPSLAASRFEKMGATRQSAKEYFFQEYGYIYRGQTALHAAAAIYRVEKVKKLIGAGANVRAADRLGAQPIHLAMIGLPARHAAHASKAPPRADQIQLPKRLEPDRAPAPIRLPSSLVSLHPAV